MTQAERLQVLQNCFDYGLFCDCCKTKSKDDGVHEELVHDCDAVQNLIDLLECM